MYNPDLERELEEIVYKIFGGRSGKLGVGCHAPPLCDQQGNLVIYIGTNFAYHRLILPVRIPEKNLFPADAMLHFMGQAPLPTKRAKPRDWIEMVEQFAKEVRAKYDDDLTPR